jgi:hypothetical protein
MESCKQIQSNELKFVAATEVSTNRGILNPAFRAAHPVLLSV